MSDAAWIAEAARLGEAARGRTAPNPNVGCVIVADDTLVASGATAPGGRPHAEAVALAAAGEAARGATLYTTLEPCAHASERGPTCAALIPAAGIARVVIGLQDPDPRTAGQGIAMLRAAGIDVTLLDSAAARDSLSGYLTRLATGRPRITLKLALSIDGKIALALGRIEMDHRRGRARPRPPRTRAQRHDPRRARHLSRRFAQPRRPPPRA